LNYARIEDLFTACVRLLNGPCTIFHSFLGFE
jgi:hypothetical protein